MTGIRAQQDSASGMGTAADLEGTAQVVADDADEKTFCINIHKPRERYVRLVVDRATQNAVVSSATYIQYGPRTIPNSTHGSNVAIESFVSPAEGTA